jgi:hypothetical protein
MFSAVVLTPPAHGVLNGMLPTVTYTPTVNFYGNDSFTFAVTDSATVVQASSAASIITSTVEITVSAVNDTPLAASQAVTTTNQLVTITLTASDVDGDPLTYALVAAPQNGTVNGSAPELFYTPNPDFVGIDQLTFQVSDGQVASNIAGVTIRVLGEVQDPAPTQTFFLPLVTR